MENPYDERYGGETYYWGTRPSRMAYEVLQRLPPDAEEPYRPRKLLVIGCGEGRNAVFFARNGYHVTAFDLSAAGVEKTERLAARAGTRVRAFQTDVNAYRLDEPYDVLFTTGVLHYVPAELRAELFCNYRRFTRPGGLHVMSVFVHKPFIPRAPDSDATADADAIKQRWISGELFTHYADWRIEYCTEEIFDCMSSGVPHQHAVNRVVARKEAD
jgi:tellurite methyltransferase